MVNAGLMENSLNEDEMKQIKGKTRAWFVPHSSVAGPQDLSKSGAVSQIGYSDSDSMHRFGWSLIGEAEITVTVPDERELVDHKVQSLREQKRTVLAEAHAKATTIESQIQTLLAITFEG